MKFRFCGDLDCPDWLLAEMSILSKMSSVKMKLLCAQVVAEMLGGEIDYAKAAKLTADAKFEVEDLKAAIAALNLIFLSSARHGVDGDTLSNELQQLGLPKEHANALCKIYGDKVEHIRDVLRQKSMRTSRLKDVEWRVDYVLSSSLLEEISEPEVQLKLVNVESLERDQEEAIAFSVNGTDFRTMLSELKQAYKLMEDLS
eukprot:Seg1442.4 transcript_id=Seg1442.4/GoldUCD/mRNA.D3Y31 product="COMM domain-containing protein 4" protein_id=Seg1442.4/GoldUCD/D3Y31